MNLRTEILNRVARALDTLQVQQIGPGQYVISGGAETHYVDLAEDRVCDCDDRIGERTNLCKHIIAVRLHLGGILQQYRAVVAAQPRSHPPRSGA